jgi:LysM repeat protein
MNFASQSVKNKSTRHSASFSLNVEMPKGHFFAVLDFTSHDFANLDASLTAKLQTIASSFTSVSSFSADLFLGFMAKEINNFVHNLAEQSGDSELRCSAALCLLGGNALSYLLSGDAVINVVNDQKTLQLDESVVPEAKLGANHLETPLTADVQTATLQEPDIVFVMSKAAVERFAPHNMVSATATERDAQAIADGLSQATLAANDDRALIVIVGPYAPPLDAAAANDLRASLAALESRLDLLAENASTQTVVDSAMPGVAAERVDQKFTQAIAELKDHLASKPSTLDFLELDEKVQGLTSLLAGKAQAEDLLELRRDVVKLDQESKAQFETSSKAALATNSQTHPRSFIAIALLVLVVGLGAGFLGGWLALRRAAAPPEVWSVKTSGNEMSIRREDGKSGSITFESNHPLTTGEQRFSSFSDVQRYIATLSNAPAPSQTGQGATNAVPAAESTEVTIKPGDSLKKLAHQYNVAEEKVRALNPEIKRWETIHAGQKVIVPSVPSVSPTEALSPSPAAAQTSAALTPTGTTEVTVGPGDSLNELARRFNTTAARLKELNPQMNWPRIQTGQKVMVPSPSGG